MKKKNFLKWLLIIIGILIFLGILVFSAFKVIGLISAGKRASHTPPTVTLNSPQSGEAFAPGETLGILASALGRTPIQYIEFWFDGALAGKVLNSQLDSGLFHAEFAVEIAEGNHSLYVRAVDQEGLIGQTIPIPVFASAEFGAGTTPVYPAQAGESLQGIAEEFGVDVSAVQDVNPGLGEGVLPPGTVVNLPPAAIPGADALPPATTAPPPTQGGIPEGITYLPWAQAANPLADAFKTLTRFKPPAAPTGPKVFQDGCFLVLSWMDSSKNEDNFNIWISGLGVPPRILDRVSSSAHTGRVWYRFTTPTAGIYNFWVEAENAIGKQPGEAVWVGVPPMECGDAVKTAGFLYLGMQRLEVYGNYDRLYCYLSAEGSPEMRFPNEKSLFFTPPAGAPEATITIGGSLVLQYPEDGVLDLEGECLVWRGASLTSLGKFTAKLQAQEGAFRDEFRDLQHIETPNFNIWISVRPYGWETPQESSYTHYDPTLPVPYNLRLEDTGKSGNPFYPTDKILRWDWDGDEEKITGFVIIMYGKEHKAVSPSKREVYLSPPAVCGEEFEIIVEAYDYPSYGWSQSSQALVYPLKPCRMLAEIQLISMDVFRSTRSTAGFKDDCAPLEVRYALWGSGAHEVSQEFFGYPYQLDHYSNYFNNNPKLVIKCKKHYEFSQIGHTDKIRVPIDPNNPRLAFGMYMQSLYSGHVVWIKDEITLPLDQWQGFEDVREYNQNKEGAQTSTIIRIRGFTDVGQ